MIIKCPSPSLQWGSTLRGTVIYYSNTDTGSLNFSGFNADEMKELVTKPVKHFINLQNIQYALILRNSLRGAKDGKWINLNYILTLYTFMKGQINNIAANKHGLQNIRIWVESENRTLKMVTSADNGCKLNVKIPYQ